MIKKICSTHLCLLLADNHLQVNNKMEYFTEQKQVVVHIRHSILSVRPPFVKINSSKVTQIRHYYFIVNQQKLDGKEPRARHYYLYKKKTRKMQILLGFLHSAVKPGMWMRNVPVQPTVSSYNQKSQLSTDSSVICFIHR